MLIQLILVVQILGAERKMLKRKNLRVPFAPWQCRGCFDPAVEGGRQPLLTDEHNLATSTLAFVYPYTMTLDQVSLHSGLTNESTLFLNAFLLFTLLSPPPLICHRTLLPCQWGWSVCLIYLYFKHWWCLRNAIIMMPTSGQTYYNHHGWTTVLSQNLNSGLQSSCPYGFQCSHLIGDSTWTPLHTYSGTQWAELFINCSSVMFSCCST